ncbi:MAG TPA: M23 family metallopeptidase [Candidatus Binatia bacterium]|nr:M23 family metallopeptidase [Candidatus Binatia bacterium]
MISARPLAPLLLALAASACAVQAATADKADEPSALPLRGDWIQGGVLVGHVERGSQVTLDGMPLRVAPDGAFVFGLDRDAPAQVELVVRSPAGAELRWSHAVARREWDVQRLEGVPPDKVTPPKSALKRIQRENAKARAARMRDTARSDFAQSFAWPCEGRISGIFGSQRILNGIPKQPHYGVDVAVPVGTEVRAPAGGVVALAAKDMYYTGGTLILDHGHGLSSTLMHLSKLQVKQGQVVKRGEVVALSGMTGRATGPHLHWGMSWFDRRVDAQLLAGPMPGAGSGH